MTDWNETGSVFAPANQEKFDLPAPTPLERLEAWVAAQRGRSCHIWHNYEDGWMGPFEVRLTRGGTICQHGHAPTLDAAILAALAQAEEKTHE